MFSHGLVINPSFHQTSFHIIFLSSLYYNQIHHFPSYQNTVPLKVCDILTLIITNCSERVAFATSPNQDFTFALPSQGPIHQPLGPCPSSLSWSEVLRLTLETKLSSSPIWSLYLQNTTWLIRAQNNRQHQQPWLLGPYWWPALADVTKLINDKWTYFENRRKKA